MWDKILLYISATYIYIYQFVPHVPHDFDKTSPVRAYCGQKITRHGGRVCVLAWLFAALLVDVVSVPLHHAGTFIQIFRAVVGGANPIALDVRKLAFYHI